MHRRSGHHGLIGYHLVRDHLVGAAAVPLLYAAAMAAAAVAGLITGFVYDRSGPWILLLLPILIAVVPVLAFSTGLVAVMSGIPLWGAATGVKDSTGKALVADLVPRHRRATAYGLFAAVQGAGALVGGGAAGALYQHSRTALIIAVGASQVVALCVLLRMYAVRTAATPR